MPKYEVLLSRTVTQRYRLEVQADAEQRAIEQAQAQQGDVDFHEGSTADPEYGVEEVHEVEDDHGKKNPTPNQAPYEIARTLVLSTGHITKMDGDLLDQDRAPVIAFAKAAGRHSNAPDDDFGYWVWVPDDQSDSSFLTTTTTIRQAGYSQAFVDLLHLTRRLGCQWLMLDRDGELRTHLPRFDW